MSNENYDGSLISELGVKRYLKATKDIKTSNIKFLLRDDAAQKAWRECSFSCHGPTYRSLKRPSTQAELLMSLDKVSPVLSGVVDGLHHQTVGKIDRIAKGVKRTGEGLNISSEDGLQKVGEENYAAFEFAQATLQKMMTFEIDVLENPISQIIMAVVYEYVSVLPEWLIEELVNSSALIFPEKIDTLWLMKAASFGIVEAADHKDIGRALAYIEKPAQRAVVKQLGKKLASVVASIIAVSITKKLLATSPETMRIKRSLVRLRRSTKQSKGGLGGALLTLLGGQGVLQKAAEASRRLEKVSPRLWRILRFKLRGANMAYFLLEDMIKEYVDRLAILEQNPEQFGALMKALIRDKKTRSIFFPYD